MKPKNVIPLALGALVLSVPALFAALNILQYELGLPIAWGPFEALTASAASPLARNLLDLSIVLAPVVAAGLLSVPYVRVRLTPGQDTFLTVSVVRLGRASLALVGLCLLVLAVFTLYFLGENWACLIGRQSVC